MPFMTNCTTKGCGKYQAPILDKVSNKVYCSECGAEITNLSHFAKIQMTTLGQVKKPAKQAYTVRCEKCRQESLPKIDGNDKLVCSSCNNIINNIGKPFEILIRNAIKKGNEEL